jgi:hypothetical protein
MEMGTEPSDAQRWQQLCNSSLHNSAVAWEENGLGKVV